MGFWSGNRSFLMLGEGRGEDMDNEADDSPALPSIPQHETLIFPRSHTLLSNIIKCQADDLGSM